jgi:predicted AAA+ superfamily ATPase
MKRVVTDKLLQWRDSAARRPLVVRGARQVGKTYSILDFGRAAFSGQVHHVDLELRRDAHAAFGDDVTPATVLRRLQVILGIEVVPGRDLLFIDEIQACPRAITSLRYFHESMPELHVAAAGSLLEFALGDDSFPVGRVEPLYMRPLTFVEYLWATGNEVAADVVAAGPRAVDPAIHEALLARLREYLFVGGMPAAVQAFVDSGVLGDAFAVQDAIVATYRDDFGKYGVRVDNDCIDEVLRSVARSVGRQVKYARLAQGSRNSTIKRCFDLLAASRVVERVPSASPAGLPLGASPGAARFKATFLDVGLMQRLNGMPHDIDLATADLMGLYEGALAEQFVGQELRATLAGHPGGDGLYYWTRVGEARNATAEVDYLVTIGGRLVPIEVKSGPAGKLRSLHVLLKQYPQCAPGLVLSEGPYAELPEQQLVFAPLYFAGSLGGLSGARTE